MKISYNDMFTNISDVAYEILEENDMFNDETDDMFSSDRTCKDVTDMIHDQKIVRKRHFAIKSVLLVAALAAMSSILAIAHNYGAALIDDSNRHLVGKGLHGEGQIIGADEEIEVPDEPSDGIWETTARIKSYKNVSVENKGGKCFYENNFKANDCFFSFSCNDNFCSMFYGGRSRDTRRSKCDIT